MTQRRLSVLILVVALVMGSVPARADSLPVIQGGVSTLELCEQATCGAAIFVGIFRGQVGFNTHALGTVAVAVNHAPLPDPGQPSPITRGVWQIQLLSGRKFTGAVTGGTLFNNGDNTFHVTVDMLILTGAVGTLSFTGTLSHNAFPPTLNGFILQ